MEDYNAIKQDFNEIAQLDETKWNHNNCYFSYLMRFVPEGAGTCLDIGCGKGELSSMLARACAQVTAVDLADGMIEKAKILHPAKNIDYICGNILDMEFEDESLDVIITTATAHHLPYEWMLEFAKRKLKKGGRLIILDLAKAHTLSDYALWSFAVIPNVIINVIKNGAARAHGHSKAAWDKHCAHDSYMTMGEIRAQTKKHIPGAYIKRKLFWRYVLVWEKER
jgi:2-polyprenyl-3-methyl-5-hydroxy-6-metoxy-1,4-benzoquinol methylase